MKRLLFLIVGVVCIGCSTLKSEPTSLVIQYPVELEAVHGLIVEKKTDDARLKIDDYLNKAENIHWYGHAYFLKAFLYELDNNLDSAVQYYRSAIQHASAYDAKVEAKSLYNLSFVFEKIQRQDELLTSLIDLMKRREFFDVLTGHVEIPARLAAAYASVNKMKEARIFHREARQNFNSMVRRNQFRASKDEISKSLYYLGFSVFDPQKQDYDVFMQKLSLGQKYFLAAAEASDGIWSIKAADRLLGQYDAAWGMVQSYKQEGFDHDPVAKKKRQQMRQLVMASDLYDLVHRLRVEEFPMSNVNRRSKRVMEKSSEWLQKMERFALNLKLGPHMTRNKKIKNKKLAIYVEKKEVPVKVNQEVEKIEQKPLLPSKKENIGKDPNL